MRRADHSFRGILPCVCVCVCVRACVCSRPDFFSITVERIPQNEADGRFSSTSKCKKPAYIWVSHELRSLLRESVLYVKIYRYNPKHLCPKLNGYGDNGQRKVLTSCISAYCTSSAVRALTLTEQCSRHLCECISSAQRDNTSLLPDMHALCTVLGNPKDNHDMSASVFVVQFNGFISLTS